MKVSKITTQFSSRLELLDGKFLRIGSLVVLGLDLTRPICWPARYLGEVEWATSDQAVLGGGREDVV